MKKSKQKKLGTPTGRKKKNTCSKKLANELKEVLIETITAKLTN